jgi:hypothetical protein
VCGWLGPLERDARCAHAPAKPLSTLHPEEHDLALEAVDEAAGFVRLTPEQVARALVYVTTGRSPARRAFGQRVIRPASDRSCDARRGVEGRNAVESTQVHTFRR